MYDLATIRQKRMRCWPTWPLPWVQSWSETWKALCSGDEHDVLLAGHEMNLAF